MWSMIELREIRVFLTLAEELHFDRLRRDELDVLAMCLSISEAEVVIGPVVSCEERVLAVAANHPLVSRGSVLVEDLADYTATDIPTFSREVIDAFGPPRTPSGRPIRRAAMHSVAEAMVRVAAGEVVHPTVPAIIDRYRHLGIAALPIRDLAPAETALMWLQSRNGPKVQAFAQAAADVLSG
jgi:DNA-binding transcriptional LysR family regulator